MCVRVRIFGMNSGYGMDFPNFSENSEKLTILVYQTKCIGWALSKPTIPLLNISLFIN